MGMNMDQSRTTTTNIAVQGAENSQANSIEAIGINNENVHQQIVHIDGPRKGATCDVQTVDGCTKPIIKTTVPAEDGLTRIEVECAAGRRLGWTYSTDIRSNWPFLSTWLFRGVPGDTMPISEKESNEFFKMNSELETKYGSKLHKASDGCLHLQFRHETEEKAKRMCEEKDFVKNKFLQYMAGVGKDASSCTVEASYRHVAPSSKQAEHIPNKDPHATSQSTQLASYSKRDNQAEMDTASRKMYAIRDSKIAGVVSGGMGMRGSDVAARSNVADCQHCHNHKKRRGQLPVGLQSLKNFALSALSHHALPAPIIEIYGCRRCTKVIEAGRHEFEPGKHVFFIHLFDESGNRQCFCERMQDQMKMVLSALRNTHGGILYVHSSSGIEDTRSFVDSILSSLTSPGEIDSDVFECEFDETDPDILRIDVESSATFVNADLKTKQPDSLMLKYKSVSLDTLKSRFFSQRTVQNTAPTLQGVSYIEHGKAVVKLYTDIWTDSWLFGYRSVDRSLSDYVSDFVDEVHLSEYVSSLSNRRNGGNIFVGGESFRSGKLKGDMRGLNIASPGKQWEDEFKRALEQELVSRICVFRNTYSDVNDVFTIGIHNTGDGKYIIEVAVGPVNGCVFHDPLGPASFELEERVIARLKYNACVRLSFDDWLKKTFPEMKIGNTEHK